MNFIFSVLIIAILSLTFNFTNCKKRNIAVINNYCYDNLKQSHYTFCVNDFYKFTYSNRWKIVIVSAILLISYGRFLWHSNTLMDNAVLYNDPDTVWNWLEIGRQGGVLTRFIFESFENLTFGLNYNPYFTMVFSSVTVVVVAVFFSYFINVISSVDTKFCFLLSIIFLVHPIWVEQIYYAFQVIPILFAICCAIASVMLQWNYIVNKNVKGLIVSVLLLIWAISTYQMFNVFYIMLVAILIITYIINNSYNVNFIDILKKVVTYILVFIISFIINNSITKQFFYSDGDYITGKFEMNMTTFFNNIKTEVVNILFSNDVWEMFSATLLPTIFILVILLIVNCRVKVNYFINVVFVLFLNLMTFFILFISGSKVAIRVYFVIPLIIALNILLCIMLIKNITPKKIYMFVLIFMIITSQMASLSRVIYSYDVNLEQTINVAKDINKKVLGIAKNNNIDNPKIAIVGLIDIDRNEIAKQGDIISLNNFNFMTETDSRYSYSLNWIYNVLKVYYPKLKSASDDEILNARIEAQSMPLWPAEESAKLIDDVVVVKLSDDIWFSEDFDKIKHR